MSKTARFYSTGTSLCPSCGVELPPEANAPCPCLLDEKDRPRDCDLLEMPKIIGYARAVSGVSTSTVYRMIANGELHVYRLDHYPLRATFTGSVQAAFRGHEARRQLARERSDRNLLRWVTLAGRRS